MNDLPAETKPALNPPPVGPAFLVSQVGAHAAVRFGELLAPLDLKPHDAGILRMLQSNPGLTQQALSELLGMFPSRLVLLLDRLEERKLIKRRNSPDDRRVYQLHLTSTGRKALAAVGRLTQSLEDHLFAALTPQELETLSDLLRRIAAQQQVTPGVHPAYRQLGKR